MKKNKESVLSIPKDCKEIVEDIYKNLHNNSELLEEMENNVIELGTIRPEDLNIRFSI